MMTSAPCCHSVISVLCACVCMCSCGPNDTKDCPVAVEARERINVYMWLRCRLTLAQILVGNIHEAAGLFPGLDIQFIPSAKTITGFTLEKSEKINSMFMILFSEN